MIVVPRYPGLLRTKENASNRHYRPPRVRLHDGDGWDGVRTTFACCSQRRKQRPAPEMRVEVRNHQRRHRRPPVDGRAPLMR